MKTLLNLTRWGFQILFIGLTLLFVYRFGIKLMNASSGGGNFTLTIIENRAGRELFFAFLFAYGFVEFRYQFVTGFLIRFWRSPKRIFQNSVLMMFSLLVGLVLVELFTRPFAPTFTVATRVVEDRANVGGQLHWAKAHEDIGYVPLRRSEFGTPDTHPLDKPKGRKRVLFAGDSIAEQRYLEKAVAELAGQYGSGELETWNNGVRGYSTTQEVKFFQEYTRPIKPDLVVLEFCLNDFDGTPVVFEDSEQGFVVMMPQLGQGEFNPWLFRNSTIYRFWLMFKKDFFINKNGRSGRVNDLKNNLLKFKQMADQDGFDLKIVIYPLLLPYDQWPEKDRFYHRELLTILDDIKLEHYDLKPLLDEVLQKQTVRWIREGPEDPIHPSMPFSRMIARQLVQQGLLR